eukprot:jgi/Orpsp1_1/1179293/evm.model.c7180000068787.1
MTNTFLKIYNSHISGEYTCGIIKSINSYVLLYQTYVENAFSANGSVINALKGIVYINYCDFINNYSYDSGGLLYLDRLDFCTVFGIYVSNSTAIVTLMDLYISNIYIPPSSNNSGIIARVNDNTGISAYNIRIDNVSCFEKNSCSMFDLSGYSILDIK